MKILVFGAAKDEVGMSEFRYQIKAETTVTQLKSELLNKYPGLKKLKSLTIAVNEEYVSENTRLDHDDVIALIPPVSGG